MPPVIFAPTAGRATVAAEPQHCWRVALASDRDDLKTASALNRRGFFSLESTVVKRSASLKPFLQRTAMQWIAHSVDSSV